MRRWLLLLALALLTTGCKVTRKVVEDERREWSIDSIATVQKGHQENLDIDWVRQDSAWWRQHLKIVIYDTDKKTEDGQYPIKAIIESDAEGGKVNADSLAVDKSVKDTLSQSIQVHDEGEVETHKKRDTSVDSRFPYDMLLLVVVVFLIVISVKLWLKR